MIAITYLDNSGFSLSYNSHLLVFDYYNDKTEGINLSTDIIKPDLLRQFERVSVFISHSHSDHFNPVVFTWRDQGPAVSYHVSYELAQQYPGRRYRPGTRFLEKDMEVSAFGSTDIGVSFLVDLPGLRIFHAGDLNFWHWREESSPREIEQADKAFTLALTALEASAREHAVSVAFFPIDPRLGDDYDAGGRRFLDAVRPCIFIPMHATARPEAVLDFTQRYHSTATRVIPLATRRGQSIQLKKEEYT